MSRRSAESSSRVASLRLAEQSGDAIGDRRRQAADPAADHRQARGHRLDRGPAQPLLGDRGHDADVRRPVVARKFVLRDPADEPGELVEPARRVAGDDQLEVGPRPPQSPARLVCDPEALDVLVRQTRHEDRLQLGIGPQGRLVGRGPGKPGRVHTPGDDLHAAGVGCDHRLGERVEDEHGLGLLQRAAERAVVLGGADPGEGPLAAVEVAGGLPPAIETAAAGVGRGELMLRTLSRRARLRGEEAEIIERAEALLRLEPQEVGVAAHRLGQDRLGVPGVGDDHVVGGEGVDGLAEPLADRGGVPRAFAEVEGLRGDRQRGVDAANTPIGESRMDVTDLVAGAGEELGELDGVDDPAACRGPIEQKTEDRDSDRAER
jgi:hypothetical protein